MIGTWEEDPKITVLESGKKVSPFSLATNEYFTKMKKARKPKARMALGS